MCYTSAYVVVRGTCTYRGQFWRRTPGWCLGFICDYCVLHLKLHLGDKNARFDFESAGPEADTGAKVKKEEESKFTEVHFAGSGGQGPK